MSSVTVVSRAASGMSALFVGNVVQRLVTFSLRTALLSYVTPSEMGYAAVRLDLLRSTVLFISREAARLVALRAPLNALSPIAPLATRAHLANLAWLPLPVGLILTALVWAWGNAFGSASFGPTVPHAFLAFVLFLTATVIEIAGEPAFIFSEALLLSPQRAGAEAAGALIEGIVMYTSARAGYGAAALGMGAVARATVLATGLWLAVLREARTQDRRAGWRALLPQILPPLPPPTTTTTLGPRRRLAVMIETQLGVPQVALLTALTTNGVVKHVLTEGDKLALAMTASLSTAGEYSVAHSYGSLALRIVFAPLEEALRSAVSKLADDNGSSNNRITATTGRVKRGGKEKMVPRSSSRTHSPAPLLQKNEDKEKALRTAKEGDIVTASTRSRSSRRSKSPAPTPILSPIASNTSFATAAAAAIVASPSLNLACEIFISVLHAVLLVGALSAGLGSAFAPLIARLFLPRAAAQGNIPSLLSAYAIAVPFFALNGVSEAFATGAAGPARLKEASLHLAGVTSVGAAAVAYFVPHYGACALIAINAATLLLRAMSALRYTAALMTSRGLGGVTRLFNALPHTATSISLIIISVAAHTSFIMFSYNVMMQVAAAAFLSVFALILIWVFEGRKLKKTVRLLRSGK